MSLYVDLSQSASEYITEFHTDLIHTLWDRTVTTSNEHGTTVWSDNDGTIYIEPIKRGHRDSIPQPYLPHKATGSQLYLDIHTHPTYNTYLSKNDWRAVGRVIESASAYRNWSSCDDTIRGSVIISGVYESSTIEVKSVEATKRFNQLPVGEQIVTVNRLSQELQNLPQQTHPNTIRDKAMDILDGYVTLETKQIETDS